MNFAEVAVDSVGAKYGTFTYCIPEGLPVTVGQLVWVPFGPRLLQGVVLGISAMSSIGETKEIADLIDEHPMLSSAQIALAKWLSAYYLLSPFEAVSLMLPPGVQQHILTTITPTVMRPFPSLLMALSDDERLLYEKVCQSSGVEIDALKRLIPPGKLSGTIDRLLRKGFVAKTTRLAKPKVGPKIERCVRLIDPDVDLPKQARSQRAVLAYLKERLGSIDGTPTLDGGGPLVSLSEVQAVIKASSAVFRALERLGALVLEDREVRRDPLAHRHFVPETAPEFTPAQEAIWEDLMSHLGSRLSASEELPGSGTSPVAGSSPPVILLHGVTGSGKTEIYLRAIAEVVARGKGAIVMVPEISLTAQTINRFSSRFPGGRVAILHSGLTLGEQFDEWRRIAYGQADVAIGARSAIFAPVRHLGLVIVDEEHEWTYKQDNSPRYHARDVAIQLAGLSGAVVILGSATPDVITYSRAQSGEYLHLELAERVATVAVDPEEQSSGTQKVIANAEFPKVEIVDLRDELRSGNRSIFSRSLAAAMSEALAAKQQVILFLNRRGTATFVACRACGYVIRCRRCDISLTYHANEDGLICHMCNYRRQVPTACPACHSPKIRYLGLGTERVEEEMASAFPTARLLRWDRDATKGRNAHEKILRQFSEHGADVLIGTQMIAKGLHLPLVTVVGVINADVGLYLPDYRAGERAFQILTQVAGRAGRGALAGQVIVQTYNPEHYAIKAVQEHDYRSFYQTEIEYRRQHGAPPYSSLVRLAYANTNERSCETEAKRLARQLREVIEVRGLSNMAVIGPAPAFFSRVRSSYRWQIVVRGSSPKDLIGDLRLPFGWTIDVDPVTLL